MERVELEECIEMRCTLYELFAYESDYLSIPSVSALPDEEKLKQREQDKQDFLDWLWLSPLARGLAGDVGVDEFERLRKFAEVNRLDCGCTRHDYRRLEEAIKDAVEDDLVVPVIDRTDDWRGDYVQPAGAQVSSVSSGLLHTSGDSFARLSNAFGSGGPILAGPYDPAMQEAKIKAARGDADGLDWLASAEAVAGVVLGGAGSRGDDGGDSMLKSFGRGDDRDASLLDSAQPFEYQSEAWADDTFDLAGLPFDGDPGWIESGPRQKKQWRMYGADGTPVVDIDFDDHHGQPNPHAHNWDGKERDHGWPVSIFPR